MQVLLGTGNASKVDYFRKVFSQTKVEFLTLTDLGLDTDEGRAETGRTPAENAAVKAAYYGQYAPFVVCNDAGLYFDMLELEDPRQPGLHIRTPMGGARLDDEQMIAYYSQLVHSLGGKALAYYLDGFALKTPEGIETFQTSRQEARSRAFWMTDTPLAERRPGWPLDSLSRYLDGVSFLHRTEENHTQTKASWVSFLQRALTRWEEA